MYDLPRKCPAGHVLCDSYVEYGVCNTDHHEKEAGDSMEIRIDAVTETTAMVPKAKMVLELSSVNDVKVTLYDGDGQASGTFPMDQLRGAVEALNYAF